MLFNVNVAAVVALALAMSAYAAPIEGPSPSNPAAPAAGAPVPRDLPPSPAPGSHDPSVRVNQSQDSSPSYIEAKGNDNHSKRNHIDDFKKHAGNVEGTRKPVDV
ncbi:hypothetical protein ARMGADRAFT_1018039 [Armillaria gallica]|uniref:Uncharacterized protein n=1 Tax=Armillaria gallica TaxID=47427 RepID=A0A2H3DD10_ARMGA|nr:hypothetical protein ARMGADRAFT_1018039 [Armillaria gallica]